MPIAAAVRRRTHHRRCLRDASDPTPHQTLVLTRQVLAAPAWARPEQSRTRGLAARPAQTIDVLADQLGSFLTPGTEDNLVDPAHSLDLAHQIPGATTRAGVSSGPVYSCYDAIVEPTVPAIPIDADHLPDHVSVLYDAGLANPAVVRFVDWYALERGDSVQAVRPVVAASVAGKTAAIEDAQRGGTVTAGRTASELLAPALTITDIWQRQDEDVRGLVPDSERRRVIVGTVRELVAP